MNGYDQSNEVYRKLVKSEAKLAEIRELVHGFSPALYRFDEANLLSQCGPYDDPEWTPAKPVDKLLERLIALL